MQDDIATAVVGQLKVTLLGAAPKAKPADPKAYALFLQGRQLQRQNSSDSLEQAVTLYQQSLGIDPNMAAAWNGLAVCYLIQASAGSRSNDEAYQLAREAVKKSLVIDPELALAHATLGAIARTYNDYLSATARHFEHALALEPANTEIISTAMLLLRSLGRLDQAVAFGEYLVAHDPVDSGGHARLGAPVQHKLW